MRMLRDKKDEVHKLHLGKDELVKILREKDDAIAEMVKVLRDKDYEIEQLQLDRKEFKDKLDETSRVLFGSGPSPALFRPATRPVTREHQSHLVNSPRSRN